MKHNLAPLTRLASRARTVFSFCILHSALCIAFATLTANATTIDPSNYDHSMTIRPATGKVTSTLTGFPLLVRLSAVRQSWFNPVDCGTNGADLRFALADGTLLAHEIDTWNPAGESVAWVYVPSLTASTEIKAYWGVKDASLAPAVTSSDTWSDYVAVYHLGEGDRIAYDSSANGYSATNAAAVSLGSNPPIGGCANIHDLYVTRIRDLLDPNAAKPLSNRSSITFSAWVAIDNFNTGNQTYAQNARVEIARKFNGVAADRHKGGFSCRYFADNAYTSGTHTAKPLFGIFLDDSTGIHSTVENWNTTAPQSNGTWLFLTCTINGTTVAKYINGALLSDSDGKGNPRNFSHGILGPDVLPLDFGAADNSSACSTYARMDEMRIRDGAVSAAWAAADYAQQSQDDFLEFEGELSGSFVVSPIPDQVVMSYEDISGGVTPSVTVFNVDAQTELVLNADYTVAYSNNTAAGTAYAIVAGLGGYAANTNVVAFQIRVIANYYIVDIGHSANLDAINTSSISGEAGATGWSTTQGGARSVNGITEEDAIYHVWTNRQVRSPPRLSIATPLSSSIIVEPSCEWEVLDKLLGNTLTLNNLKICTGATLTFRPINDSDERNDTLAGTFTLVDGATLRVFASKDRDSARWMTLSASVTGRGAIFMPSTTTDSTYSGVLENKIDGNISGFTGDIGTWNGNNPTSLELVYANSLPGDPEPGEVAYVVVTNAATLKVDQNWISPTNRIWILGDSGTPTIEVPAGMTVEINGDLVGSVGFVKTGAGTLVLRGASPDFSGEITISAGMLRLSGKAALLSSAADVTITEAGGLFEVASLSILPIPEQTVYSLEDLAAGVKPTLVVSNLDAHAELVLGTDYTVAYLNNTTSGVATTIVSGINDYEGMEKSSDFIIHAVKRITASINLAGDEDWTGFESISVVSAGVTLDLKGHKLTITGLDGLGRITDSVGGGELHYNVPASYASGYVAKIEEVSLTGLLKLVKEGDGVLTAIKARQDFTGGTVIDGGVLRYGCSDPNIDNMYPFGAKSADGPITINAGGVLDPGGSVGWGNHHVTFNGGAVSNTVPAYNMTYGVFNPAITVNADFTFATMQNYGWAVGELNGHTATVHIATGNATLFMQSHPSKPPTSGCLNVVRGGYLRTFAAQHGRPTAFQNVDLLCNAALALDTALPVRDYAANYLGNYSTGTAALDVYGTFTPNSSFFYGPTMQNGSSIDLSAKTGAWDVKSALTAGGNPTTKFAAGATVAILLGSRTPAYGEKIVSWTSATKPADSVSLTNDTYYLHAEADGLYAEAPRTFVASDLPDLASARTSSDLAAAIEASLTVTNLVTGDALALGTDYTYTFVLDNGRCTVTITGLGDNDGLSVERTFGVGQIVVKPSDFAYSMDIAPTIGKVTVPITNFPVLVRLSTAIEKFSYAKCKADELRFFLPDGTPLAHEIDYWNENGESTVWVNIPELTADTVFRACWGLVPGHEALAPIISKAWPEYVGVWHFSEESGVVRDSSGNCYDSTNDGGGTVSNANAKVGLARNASRTAFITTATQLDSAYAAKPITAMSKFTVSGWMLSTATIGANQWPQMMRNKNVWNEGTGWYTGIEAGPDKFCGTGSGSTREIITLPVSIYNNWVYLTTVFNGTSCSVYANGVFVKTSTINTVKASTTYALRFAQDFTGRMDEYRIHDRVDDAAYIEADYATQTDPDFLTFGTVKITAPTVLILR